MYYVYNLQQSKKYIFVYDDSDRSVEYVERENFLSLCASEGINFGVREFNMDISDKFSKLKMLGFKLQSRLWLCRNFCNYYVGDLLISTELDIMGMNNSTSRIHFRFYAKDSHKSYYLDLHDNASMYVPYAGSDDVKDDYGYVNYLRMAIPSDMVMYLLNLRGRGDFDGFMNSFDNLFGRNLDRLAKNIVSTEAVLKDWS